MPVTITNMDALQAYVTDEKAPFAYTERPALPEDSRHMQAAFYTLPPHASNFPYHYHVDQEELFYIISGEGDIKTPDGTRHIRAGELIFCPAGEGGAHMITNTSDTEPLIYLDVDSIAAMDVAVYPDSNKIGIWVPA